MQYIKLVSKRSTTRPGSILEKLLMALVEVNHGLGLALLPPIIHVFMADHLFFIVMMITEVEIGTTPNFFLHITIVD